MASTENATVILNTYDDKVDALEPSVTAWKGCSDTRDLREDHTNNNNNNDNNNNNNNVYPKDACLNRIKVVESQRQTDNNNKIILIDTPRPRVRDNLSIHRAPRSKNRINNIPFVDLSISSSNINNKSIHITTPNDTTHNGADELGSKHTDIDVNITIPTVPTVAINNANNPRSCFQNNSTGDCLDPNTSSENIPENTLSFQKTSESVLGEQCCGNLAVPKDQSKVEPNELHTEPSSANTSQNSEYSSGSNSSEEHHAQKQESLILSDPRQKQVFEALTGIQSLRKDGEFSDVILRVKDEYFRGHRFILSKCSPVLHNMINNATDRDVCIQGDAGTETADGNTDSNDTHPTKAISGGSPIVVINGIEPRVFEKVLDYMYCVFDDVLNDNTSPLELLLAADTFQLCNLSQTCVERIADTVDVNNVFDIVSLVDSGCTSLTDHKLRIRCHQVLRENFLNLCTKNEFLGLNRQRMISLVADSMLVIKNEMDLIQPLIRWVSVRPSERCADLTLMLQLIRFPLITSEDLDKLMGIPLLKENSLATALVDESKTYGLKDFPERMSWPRQNCISRCQFPSRDFILWTADRNKGLHLYSIIDGLHYKVTTFNEATMASKGFTFDSTSTVCCYGDRLFFTGGEFNTDLAWSVDSETGDVSVHAKMPRGRKFHSMVASRGCIYCLGGQDKRGYTVLDSVDAYIISKGVWLKVGHMAVAAYNMTAVVSNGAIYLIGGIDHSGQPVRLIQCFAVLRSGLYSAFKVDISNMPPSLLSSRAVTSGLDGSVYIVCGHGEVYRLDMEKKTLQLVNTLKSLSKNPRFRFGLAHVGGCLVVTGGHQLGQMIQEPIRSVCMDIATKTEVKDYSPLLPADIVNTCFYAKLSSGILGFSTLSSPMQ